MFVDALSTTFRALSFVAIFQAAGTAMFIAIFGDALTVTRARVQRVGVRMASAAVIVVLIHYSLEVGRMSGEVAGAMDMSLQGMVLHSSTGSALAWRLAGLVFIAIGLSFGTPVGKTAALIGAVVVLAAFTLVGHTAASPHRWLLGILLLTHLLVVAFWFGALVPLYQVTTRESTQVAAGVVQNFSSYAVWIVPFLFAAGLGIAAMLLESLSALLLPYGILLIAKVVGFAVLMLLAALNKWRLGPALALGERRVRVAFSRSLFAEYALIAVILSTTAVLTTFFSPEG